MANMAGMMSGGNDDFSWNSNTIFDKIGNPEKREEYLTELSGTKNNERELIEQLRSLDEPEMKSILYDLPPEDKQEFINDYYGLTGETQPSLDAQNISPAPEMTVTGPDNPNFTGEGKESYIKNSGMFPPYNLKARVAF